MRALHLALAGLLASPPVVGVAWRLWGPLRPDRVEQDRVDALEAEVRRLEGDLAAIPARERLPTIDDPEGSWRIVPADVVPVDDPSPFRRVLWARPRDDSPVPADSAAIRDGALAGRVVRSYPALRLALVQSALDPGFRVRFATPAATGMLRGTGMEEDGYPILDILYLDPDATLSPKDPVRTEGHDGVYPPGVPIGEVEGPDGKAEGGAERLRVRGSIRTSGARRLDIAVDAREEAVGEARKPTPAKGGSP